MMATLSQSTLPILTHIPLTPLRASSLTPSPKLVLFLLKVSIHTIQLTSGQGDNTPVPTLVPTVLTVRRPVAIPGEGVEA